MAPAAPTSPWLLPQILLGELPYCKAASLAPHAHAIATPVCFCCTFPLLALQEQRVPLLMPVPAGAAPGPDTPNVAPCCSCWCRGMHAAAAPAAAAVPRACPCCCCYCTFSSLQSVGASRPGSCPGHAAIYLSATWVLLLQLDLLKLLLVQAAYSLLVCLVLPPRPICLVPVPLAWVLLPVLLLLLHL